MKLRHHLLSGVGLGACGWLMGAGRSEILVLSGVAGLLDADHLIDLAVYRKSKRPDEGFFDVFNHDLWVKNYLPLHSYELLFLLVPLILQSSRGSLWLAASIGLLVHLVLDQCGNKAFPLTYSFIYRAYRRFDAHYFWRGK